MNGKSKDFIYIFLLNALLIKLQTNLIIINNLAIYYEVPTLKKNNFIFLLHNTINACKILMMKIDGVVPKYQIISL